MKKLFNIAILFTFCVFITGCSDDDKTEDIFAFRPVATKGIENLNAAGGEGSITMPHAGITATSNRDWCTVTSVVGEVVSVKTNFNHGIEGRTALIEIKSADGKDSYTVPISQRGLVFSLYTPKSGKLQSFRGSSFRFSLGNGGSQRIVVETDMPSYEVSLENADWLTFDQEKDTLDFKVLPAAKINRAKISFKMGGIEVMKLDLLQDSILYKDLLGTWDFNYTDSLGESKSYPVTLTQKVDGLSYNFNSLKSDGYNVNVNQTVVLTFDAASESIKFSGQPRVSQIVVGGKVVRPALCLIDKDGALSSNVSHQYEGNVDTSLYPNIGYKFSDNGTWGSNVADGISLFGYTTFTPSPAGEWGAFGIYRNVTLKKQ
ncbi:MAG: BACON domain-containing protein [Dysgonomonas sp.]